MPREGRDILKIKLREIRKGERTMHPKWSKKTEAKAIIKVHENQGVQSNSNIKKFYKIFVVNIVQCTICCEA